jgi:hypothetical protein
MSATQCVVCTKPRESEHGLLCVGHYTHLAAMLRDIQDQAAVIDLAPSMAQQTDSGGGSLASERAPLRMTALAFLDPQTRRWTPDIEPKPELPAAKAIGPWCLFCEHETCMAWRAGRQRDQHNDEHDAGSERLMSVLGVLHSWARIVREDRELSAPNRVTVTSERDLLSRNLEWIAGEPWIDECYSDLRELLESLKALNHTEDDKPAGTCFLLTETGACGGRIWRKEEARVVWRVMDDRCSREPVTLNDGPAYCERCNTKWEGEDLARLNLILEQQKAELARPMTADGRPMLTAAELCSKLGMRWGTLRTKASRLGVKAVRGHYDEEWFTRKGRESVA